MGLAAFRYLLYDASLDVHGSVQKKKVKLHEIAGDEKIKQEWFFLPCEFTGKLTQGILKLDLGAKVSPRQPHSTRSLSKIFFYSYKVKVSYHRHYNVFISSIFLQ